MAVREIGRNDEWRDLASVPSPMPSPAWFWSCDSRSYPSSDGLDDRREMGKSKRHETVWRAVASRKGNGNIGGATWPQFLKSCRAQLASTTSAPPQGGFMPAPAPAPSPAPTQSGSLFPWQRPATPPAGSVASTGDGSAPAQEAQYRCPGSTLFWVNEHSHIYHFPGTRDYGHTKSGANMCEAEAQTSGNRAAMNERHP
jgi:hypothetical protein